MAGRFFVTFSVNTVMQQTYEIMPTELRAQGVALSRCLSQFARIFSSYVVFSGASDPALPFYILGAGGVAAGVVRELPNMMSASEGEGVMEMRT